MTMIPSQIERDILIEAPVEVVWRAVTEPDQISQWFSDEAAIDLRPGGEGTLTWDDRATSKAMTAGLTVVTVAPPSTFAFRWGHPEGVEAGEGNSLLVEFALIQEGDNTRLRVVETGLAKVDWPEEQKAAYVDEHNKGWALHLPRLLQYVTRAPKAQ
jgi:uncharacterized protein YndB with AHSA1/START domain